MTLRDALIAKEAKETLAPLSDDLRKRVISRMFDELRRHPVGSPNYRQVAADLKIWDDTYQALKGL